MYNALVRKIDNGYRGVIVESDSALTVFSAGAEVFYRQLHPYPKETLLEMQFTLSPSGRRMFKSVCLVSQKENKVETDTYYVNQDSRLVLNTALNLSRQKPERAVKVMMVGPSGFGKTSLPRLLAEKSGMGFMRMNCASVRDPEEWFGFREAKDGSTVFYKSLFAKTIEAGNVVVVLDEFNRVEPWLHNTLFPLLDEDGRTVVHDQEFKIGRNVIVVGTINTGYKYTGVFELDEALMNRFEFVLEVGPPPAVEEIKVLTDRTGVDSVLAASIVKAANLVREADCVCSVRSTLNMAQMVVAGMNVREAFEVAVIRRLPQDSGGNNVRKNILDRINSLLGNHTHRVLSDDVFGSQTPETVVSSTAFTVRLDIDTSKFFNAVAAIKAMRSLPTLSDLGLKEAKELADGLVGGSVVVLKLTSPLSDEDMDRISAAGLKIL